MKTIKLEFEITDIGESEKLIKDLKAFLDRPLFNGEIKNIGIEKNED